MAATTSLGFGTFLQCYKSEAIQQFTEYLLYHPEDYDSLLFRGISFGIIQNVSSAICDFMEAAKYGNPCQKMVADAHRLLYEDKTEDAISTIYQTTQRFPSDPIGWHFYGAFRHSSNICDDATIAAFEKAIELQFPQAALSHYYLGEIMLSKSNHDAAVKHLAEAVKLNPTFAPAYLELGNALRKLERHESAADCFKKARQLNPSQTEAHNGPAAVQQQQNTSGAPSAAAAGQGGGRRGGGGKKGGGKKGGGDGSSDDSDRDDGGGKKGGGDDNGSGNNKGGSNNKDPNTEAGEQWQSLKSKARGEQRLYEKDNRKYVRTKLDITGKGKEEDILISKDTAKHGGAQFKVYDVKNNRAVFRGSLDHKLKLMERKHESQEGTSFRLSELKQQS